MDSGKQCNFNRTLHGKTVTVHFDPLDFMERFRGHVAFATMGATLYRDIFYDEQIFTLAEASCHLFFRNSV